MPHCGCAGSYVKTRTNQTLNSPFSDQLEAGFNWLVFDDFVEEEFRQYYAQSTAMRARLLPIVGIIAILISMGFMLSDPDVHPIAVIFKTRQCLTP